MLKFFAWLFGRSLPAPTPEVPVPKPTMTPSAKATWLALCISLVAPFEGLYTHAYKDPVGIVTICYGVTNHDRPVRMGDTYSKEECQQMLGEDLVKYMAQAKKCIPKIDSFPPHRQAAIVSFTYNVGQGNVCKSSVAKHLNAGRVQQGCDALLAWNKAGGKVLNGLTRRREAERKWCLMEN